MSKVCEKHREHPVKIYDQCVGCEIESLRSEISRLKNGRWYWRNAIIFNGAEVTHWQPLPEPPKQETSVYGNDCPGGRCER